MMPAKKPLIVALAAAVVVETEVDARRFAAVIAVEVHGAKRTHAQYQKETSH
jgi:hypothetical protein